MKLFISVLLLILFFAFLITKPIHTDEGWFFTDAFSKNELGYYTSIAFHDIPVFKQKSNLLVTRLILQEYRLINTLAINPIYQIILIRLINTMGFIVAFYFFLSSFNIIKKANRFLIINFFLFLPTIYSSISTARSEALISAIVLIILGYSNRQLSINSQFTRIHIYLLLTLSTIILFLHPNGIIYFAIINGFLIITKNFKLFWVSFVFSIVVGLLYYLVLIDPDIHNFFYFSNLFYNSGEEEKVILSFSQLPQYIWMEIHQRYLLGIMQYDFIQFYKAALNILVVLFGIYSMTKVNLRIMIKYFVIIPILFFIILGNKYIGYLVYYFPILIVASYIFLETRNLYVRKFLRVLVVILLLTNVSILSYAIKVNVNKYRELKRIEGVISKNLVSKDTIYAPFKFAPILMGEYKYLTTNQKGGNGFYKQFDIHPQNCFILAEENNSIWNFVVNSQQDTLILDRYKFSKVN